MIIEKIIIELASLHETEPSKVEIEVSKIKRVLQNVKKNTYLQLVDVREFASIGIPIISAISGVLKMSKQQVVELLRYDKDNCSEKITYQDLLLLLAIIKSGNKNPL